MIKIKSVGVYCGSTNDAAPIFKEAAHDLGVLLAKHNVELVFGGGQSGLMGITAKACMDNKGKVYGVIPRFLEAHEEGYKEATELVYVESMAERKKIMYDRSDCFIVLPGGLGTLEELFEILTWKQIGLHHKFIFIVNIKGYWSPIFSEAFDAMIAQNFVRKVDRNLFTLIERVEDVEPFLFLEAPSNQFDYVGKWG
jgi:uncharacterized protein (TIGR00730 family)